jgi:hypothetical protein
MLKVVFDSGERRCVICISWACESMCDDSLVPNVYMGRNIAAYCTSVRRKTAVYCGVVRRMTAVYAGLLRLDAVAGVGLQAAWLLG